MSPDERVTALRSVAEIQRSTRRAIVIFSCCLAALFGSVLFVILNYEPKTACSKDPSSRECQVLKIDSDKARSPRSACIITELAGLGCPALDDKRQARKDARDPSGPRAAAGADDAHQSGATNGGPTGDGSFTPGSPTGPPAPPATPTPPPSNPPTSPPPSNPPSNGSQGSQALPDVLPNGPTLPLDCHVNVLGIRICG